MRDLNALRAVVAEARQTRATDAYYLPDAGEFSDDLALQKDAVALVEQLKTCDEVWPELQEGTTDPVEWERRQTGEKHVVGANRMDGDAILLTLAWMLSKEPTVTHFAGFVLKNPAIVEAAGFEYAPARNTLRNRLREFESEPMLEAIENATRTCWLVAQAKHPEIGRNVHVDYTAHHTNARFHHACLDTDWCLAHGGDRMPSYLQTAGTTLIEAERHRRNSLSPDAEAIEVLEREQPTTDLEERAAEAMDEQPSHPKYARHGLHPEPQQTGVRYSDGHRFVCIDPDAGGRRIGNNPRRSRWWVGYQRGRAVCDTLGISAGTVIIPSDIDEGAAYPELMAAVEARTGFKAENSAGDKALGRRDLREWNAMNEIGTISAIPTRNRQIKDRDRLRTDSHDEYGFAFCECCDGPTRRVGIRKHGRTGEPYVVFRCLDPKTAACERFEKRIPCSEEWLLFGYMDRDSPLYFQLRRTGKSRGEAPHWYGRRRYADTSKTPETRPYIVGIDHVRLRAALSDFLDIFRVCLRFGWLGTWPRRKPDELRRRTGGEAAVKNLRRHRTKLGLTLPQGERAMERGWAWDGTVPDGWVPVKERIAVLRAQRAEARAAAAAADSRGSPDQAEAA